MREIIYTKPSPKIRGAVLQVHKYIKLKSQTENWPHQINLSPLKKKMLIEFFSLDSLSMCHKGVPTYMIAQSFKAFFCSLISGFPPPFRVWWQTPLHRQLPPPHRTPVGSSLYLWRTQEITPQPTLTSRLSKCDDCKSVIFFTWSCTAGAS